ncbi:hypothetical protein FrEUN1fDRAFT_6267 [Parafrankia sp. EUN1f]|nr:hypothetical protein FrEUN1fDRAFT_6267 [Parafrankia sp. EUN1f]
MVREPSRGHLASGPILLVEFIRFAHGELLH